MNIMNIPTKKNKLADSFFLPYSDPDKDYILFSTAAEGPNFRGT